MIDVLFWIGVGFLACSILMVLAIKYDVFVDNDYDECDDKTIINIKKQRQENGKEKRNECPTKKKD